MKRLITAIAIVALTTVSVNATIINIPDDYPTIQEGINHGSHGDTVLVQPDTYCENLNFNGHNVVLASLFLTTGDTAYISSTIIDGNQSGSVVTFSSGEDSTAQIVGFTIQNGRAPSGGGICCRDHSHPMIINNIITGNWAYGGVDNGGGGIWCFYDSHPTIMNNIIAGNSANEGGGGIQCFYSCRPRIIDNIIRGNSARLGSGIRCNFHSSPTISDNIISDNSATTWGGGIYCYNHCSPTVSNNTISGNSASGIGGGLLFYYGSPTVSHNQVYGNSAGESGGGISCYSGGGIYCYEEWLTISDNIIRGNSAGESGGGIYCQVCNPTISGNAISANSAYYGGGIASLGLWGLIKDNTISGNSARGAGGGICCDRSSPSIMNTILWADTSPHGPEIYLAYGSNPTLTYCDVQGGWPGSGNIDEDPIFVGPHNEDFCLRWRSSCIDAGHPDPIYNDPDGTRNDMGACYFKQDVAGIVEVYPHNTPIVIPPEGGDIIYDGWSFNFLGHPGRVDIWSYAFVPEMGPYGPIDLYENVRIPADSLGMNEITQHVPGAAPEGDYVFAAYVGDYPTSIIDSSYFYFTKSGSIGNGITYLLERGEWFEQGSLTAVNLPSDYAISQNYPNPFNATTSIKYQLAGYRSVVWQASEVSSGLYLYKLTAGDFTKTKRMMLVK